MIGLTGYTGFVGSNLLNQFDVGKKYNSKNFGEIKDQNFELLLVSSIPAVKWYANLNPELDLEIINKQLEIYKTITANKVVIISTIDVYDSFENKPNEDYKINTEGLDFYGKHRLYFENEMRKIFENVYILRIPALFGTGLKKNFIYDLNNKAPKMLQADKFIELSSKLAKDSDKDFFASFYTQEKNAYILDEKKYKKNNEQLDNMLEELDFTALKFTDEDSCFPYYNLNNLKKDITFAIENNIPILNTAVEVISSKEIVEFVEGKVFKNKTNNKPVNYHYTSKYANSGYFYTKEETLLSIREFIKNVKRK